MQYCTCMKIRSRIILSFLPFLLLSGTMEGRVWLVAVGIDRYLDARIPSLHYPSADVSYVLDVLAVNPSRVIPRQLLNEEATWRGLRSLLLNTLQRQMVDTDTLVFYFSGHGHFLEDSKLGNHQYIALYDSSPDDMSTYLNEDELAGWLDRIHCRLKILIFDSCSPMDFRIEAISTLPLNNPRSLKNMLIWSANQEQGKTWEVPFLNHSAFTFLLMQAWKGYADADRNGKVSVKETRRYLDSMILKIPGAAEYRPQTVVNGDPLTLNDFQWVYPPQIISQAIVVAIDSSHAVIDMGRENLPSRNAICYHPATQQRYKFLEILDYAAMIERNGMLKMGDRLEIKMPDAGGELILEVKPWAMAELNQRPYGYTPLRIKDLAPGEYKLRLTHPELGARVLNFSLTPGEQKRLFINFAELPESE